MKRLFFALFFLGCMNGFAQKAIISKGDFYFESYEYGEAVICYDKALVKSKDPGVKQYLNGRIALCYTYLFQYTKAEEYFNIVINSLEDIEPELILEYGRILKLNGKYTEAKKQFITYKQLLPTNAADFHIQSVEWAINNKETINNSYRIYQTNLDVSGQSLGYCYYGNGLIYCSGRNKPEVGKVKSAIFDIDYAINENNLEFVSRKNFFPKINFGLNEVSPSLSSDENSLYFAANATKIKKGSVENGSLEVNTDGIANYKLYVVKKRDAEFQDIQELTFNNTEYSCFHPCILSGGKTIVFSSDKPGGYGGFDLYKSTLLNDSVWGDPVNLGATVNSGENEIFPLVSGGLLFFSSKGFSGYGGYDVYVAILNDQQIPSDLKNVGLPVNSFRDDLAFMTRDSGNTGYFSSNRGTENGTDQVYFFKESQPGKLLFTSLNSRDVGNALSVHVPDSIPHYSLTRIENTQRIDFRLPDSAADVPKKGKGKQKKTGEIEQSAAVSEQNEIEVATVNPPIEVAPVIITQTEIGRQNTGETITPLTLEVQKKVMDEKKTVQVKEAAKERKIENRVRKPVHTAGKDQRSEPQKAGTALLSSGKEFTPILFNFNDASISFEQKQLADSVIILFQKNNRQKISIKAYTDCRGSAQYNISLSNRRAASVRQYLVQNGIPASKIRIKGLGEDKLLNECSDGVSCSEKQHAVNRRVIVTLSEE